MSEPNAKETEPMPDWAAYSRETYFSIGDLQRELTQELLGGPFNAEGRRLSIIQACERVAENLKMEGKQNENNI